MTKTPGFIRLLGHVIPGGLLWCDIRGVVLTYISGVCSFFCTPVGV